MGVPSDLLFASAAPDIGVELRAGGGGQERGLIRVVRLEICKQACVSTEPPLLMVALRRPERGVAGDLGGDRFAQVQCDLLGAGMGGSKLGVTVCEQRGAVLPRAPEGGVVASPETLQKGGKTDHRRIELHLQSFGVVADAVIGWVLSVAAGVADLSAVDTVETPELGVRSPESAEREREQLGVVWLVAIDRRHLEEDTLLVHWRRSKRPGLRSRTSVATEPARLATPGRLQPVRGLQAGLRETV